MKSKAFEAGFSNGDVAVSDYAISHQDPVTAEEVESWFAAGQEEPDNGLINALSSAYLYEVLGLTNEQGEARGEEWSAALDEYNRGYQAGARRAVRPCETPDVATKASLVMGSVSR